MSIQALAGLLPAWYTPKGQDDDDKPTRFKVRPLDGEQYGDVAEHVGVVNGAVRLSSRGISQCLKHALIGWENFTGVDGDVAFFAANFRLIPYLIRVELATHIFIISSLSEEQEKN